MKTLDRLETIGNRLPHPVTLFVIGIVIIIILADLAARFAWVVESPLGDTLRANSLLTGSGTWWLLSHMVENFIKFPPLGIVLVGMLGIGMAERSGLLPALLEFITTHTHSSLLTPTMIFLGIMSSVALDAGYVVLPPIAAALYLAAGRSPLTGIAAVFAGVSAGFSANLVITAIDPLLSGFTQSAATIIAPDYQVAVTANWWFMIASTFVLTITGWWVTAKWVEPRTVNYKLNPVETTFRSVQQGNSIQKALVYAGLTFLALLIIFLTSVFIPSAPLYGQGKYFSRWVEVTVPLLFLLFFTPGIVYGITVGSIKNDKDVASILGNTFSELGPYIVLAFFAAQFIEIFRYTGLGEMLAITGGQWLASLQIVSPVLLCSFILLVILANLFIGSSSAKYAFMAPVFVPMLMQVGISPELTQAAYRVGDSVSNVITPLNPYMVIILAQVQKYVKDSGMGTVVTVMLPYTVTFAILWSGLLVIWMMLDIPLGPGGHLHFNLQAL
jgi:aminobenzoyl-glutamate transport protein